MEKRERIWSYRNEAIDRMIENHKANNLPYSPAEAAVVQGYYFTNDKEYDFFIAENLPEKLIPVDEFLGLLKDAGITQFVIADKSTALMQILHNILQCAWAIKEPFEDTRKSYTIRGLWVRGN